ncbi:long-chain fatty acid--CoA ligase [Algiphilus sp.]|uniref:acyl-CoA synthetase n=1 Tax=Algiphilus sp. TaxID=1872431 RepID=UPI0025BD8343|nr:long-chain fatty acid--CoA ligase [Algiphilus sp.]MCK5772122.1 long-chain fatty acid--CoA ligase [Algiphilus sp.]
MFLTQLLHKARRERPDATCTVGPDSRRTHAEVADRVARLAAVMRDHGVRPGDRVAMLAANAPEYLEFFFAGWWCGAVVTPINARWSPAEVVYALDDSGSRLLITDNAFLATADAAREQCAALETVALIGAEQAEAPTVALEAAMAAAEPMADIAPGGSDLAAILYTGGTTGKPKGVMLSHDNFAINAIAAIGADPRTPRPVILHCAPMFHIGGMGLVIQGALRGATHIFPAAFDPPEVLRLIESERATESFLVPTMIRMLIEHEDFPKRDTSSLGTVLYGAAPIDPRLLDQALTALPQASFTQLYGQTECSPIITALPGWCHAKATRALDKLASAGQPVSTAEISIRDTEGNELPTGEVGEICARGPTVMQGYWNKPEQTAEVLGGDGWLRTGDGGYLDDDAFLFVVDRFKDMIITGGENVFSTEVENALLDHPEIAQAAVIGLPDERWGERVHAVIVPREGDRVDEEAVLAHCRERIARFKCPRSFSYRTELPLSAAGKVLKYQLRDEAKQENA